MLKEYLKSQNDSTLWALLADIGNVMGSRAQPKQSDDFWIAAASEITKEIDRRLFSDYNEAPESGND